MRKKFTLFISSVAASLLMGVASAEVIVESAWVRGTVAAQTATGAFMKLKSNQAVSLISVSSPAANMVEIHQMSIDKATNVMNMHEVEKIDIVPGKTTELKPGGYHVMLMNLVKPLKPGEHISLTLEFKTADGKSVKQNVKAEVREVTGKTEKPLH